MNEKCKIWYYWYHHMIFSLDEIRLIERMIQEGNYAFF